MNLSKKEKNNYNGKLRANQLKVSSPGLNKFFSIFR